MPARNENFPWMSHYGNYKFFEDRMHSHSKVNKICNIGQGFYQLDLYNGNVIKAFICECYSFGLAEYYESVERLGKLDAVIINSNWCGYTYEAKQHCLKNRVGLFDIQGFMAALNRDNFWECMTSQEKKYFEEKGWI